MEKKHYFLIILTLIVCTTIYLIVRMVIPQEKEGQEEVICGDRKVYRYRDPERMFPVLTRDYSASFELTGSLLNSLSSDSSGTSGTSLDVRNSARELREKLDQDNIFFQNQMKAAFEQTNSDPCNDSLRIWYRQLITEMTERVIQLKQFVAEATAQAGTQPADSSATAGTIVVDTAARKTFETMEKLPEKQLVVVKDRQKLSGALKSLKRDFGSKSATVEGGPGTVEK
jgi:hypothetical protein